MSRSVFSKGGRKVLKHYPQGVLVLTCFQLWLKNGKVKYKKHGYIVIFDLNIFLKVHCKQAHMHTHSPHTHTHTHIHTHIHTQCACITLVTLEHRIKCVWGDIFLYIFPYYFD